MAHSAICQETTDLVCCWGVELAQSGSGSRGDRSSGRDPTKTSAPGHQLPPRPPSGTTSNGAHTEGCQAGVQCAAARGWAQAALALALTYDPNELQRRGVTVPGDPIKARACYIKARELMDTTVAFYLSRLPSGSPGGREEKC
jgi:hypothetical protein